MIFWAVEEWRDGKLFRLTVIEGTQRQFERVVAAFGYVWVDEGLWFAETSVPGWKWYLHPITEGEFALARSK